MDVLGRHEALRTRYPVDGTGPYQDIIDAESAAQQLDWRIVGQRDQLRAAAVAGFVVVGFAVVALRPEAAPGGFDDRLAAAPPVDSSITRRVSSAAVPASGQVLVVDGQLIRDAQLDAYFEAHRGAIGIVPSAVPGGAPRNVDFLAPQR